MEHNKTNKTVNQAIQYHVDNNQKGWLAKLPHIQFTIMNTVNASTSFSASQLKTGRSPQIIPLLILLSADATTEQAMAHKIVTHVALNVKEAQDNLLAAKIWQAYHANEHHAPEDVYEVGDLVMLSTENHRCNYKCKGKTHIAKFMPQNDCRNDQGHLLMPIPTHGSIQTPITTHGLMQTPSLIDGKPPWMGTRPWM